MGRVIEAFALGTYYTPGSPNASGDATFMRGLVYRAKANRGPLGPQYIEHPECGIARQVATPPEAYAFVADAFAAKMETIARRLQFDPRCLTLVPIPSSEATATGMHSCRWPAMRIAEQMEARGIGKARVLVVQKTVCPPARGTGASAAQLAANLERVAGRGRNLQWPIVYVDDVISWGDHIIAVDQVLGQPIPVAAFAIAFTDSVTYDTCRKVRRRVIRRDQYGRVTVSDI